MKRYIITAQCDPHNARFHHHGEKVLKRDGATPVKWVLDDNLGEGYDEAEAKDALWKLALSEYFASSNLVYETAYSVESLIKDIASEEDRPEDEVRKMFDWFKGDGIYYSETNEPLMLKGDKSYSYDTMVYRVEEKEEEL